MLTPGSGSLIWGWGATQIWGEVGRLYLPGLGDCCKSGFQEHLFPSHIQPWPCPPPARSSSSESEVAGPHLSGPLLSALPFICLRPEGKVPSVLCAQRSEQLACRPCAFERAMLKPLKMRLEL